MPSQLKQVRHTARRPAPEERDLPARPTVLRQRVDAVAELLTRIHQLVG